MNYANPTSRDIVEWLPESLPDRRITYGDDAQQFGDLRIPSLDPPSRGFPVVTLIHGGGYSPNWNLDIASPLAEKITREMGVATWNLEYRRPGHVGGGWPGTWIDIASGIDHIATLADEYSLDTQQVIAVGHSAGATFAAWAAARQSNTNVIPANSDPAVRLSGALHLAGMLDLDQVMGERDKPPRHLQGLLASEELAGEELENRISAVSPMKLVQYISIPQWLIIGSLDDPTMIEQSRAYAEALSTESSTEGANLELVEGANHFDVIDPAGGAWPSVSTALRALLRNDL